MKYILEEPQIHVLRGKQGRLFCSLIAMSDTYLGVIVLSIACTITSRTLQLRGHNSQVHVTKTSCFPSMLSCYAKLTNFKIQLIYVCVADANNTIYSNESGEGSCLMTDFCDCLEDIRYVSTVSYTHLTLPTIYSV